MCNHPKVMEDEKHKKSDHTSSLITNRNVSASDESSFYGFYVFLNRAER